jgi:hypothetical protein
MLLFLLIVFVFVAIGIFVWMHLISSIYCRKTYYLNPDRLTGIRKIFSVTIKPRSYPANFTIAEDAQIVCNVADKWQVFTRPHKIYPLQFKELEFGFMYDTLSRRIEFFEKNERIGVFRQTGFLKNNKFLTFNDREFSFKFPDASSPDLEIFDNSLKLARITYEPSVIANRNRKIFLFEDLDIRTEAILCLTAIFSVPKFGRVYLG